MNGYTLFPPFPEDFEQNTSDIEYSYIQVNKEVNFYPL